MKIQYKSVSIVEKHYDNEEKRTSVRSRMKNGRATEIKVQYSLFVGETGTG